MDFDKIKGKKLRFDYRVALINDETDEMISAIGDSKLVPSELNDEQFEFTLVDMVRKAGLAIAENNKLILN